MSGKCVSCAYYEKLETYVRCKRLMVRTESNRTCLLFVERKRPNAPKVSQPDGSR